MRCSLWGVLLAALALTACTTTTTGQGIRNPTAAAPTTPVPSPTTFDVGGYLTLYTSFVSPTGKSGENCAGTGGFDDIANGAQIVVVGSDGAVLGTGTLEQAESNFDVTPRECRFRFNVPGVATGMSYYSFRIGVRGSNQYTEIEMESTPELTLGS